MVSSAGAAKCDIEAAEPAKFAPPGDACGTADDSAEGKLGKLGRFGNAGKPGCATELLLLSLLDAMLTSESTCIGCGCA